MEPQDGAQAEPLPMDVNEIAAGLLLPRPILRRDAEHVERVLRARVLEPEPDGMRDHSELEWDEKGGLPSPKWNWPKWNWHPDLLDYWPVKTDSWGPLEPQDRYCSFSTESLGLPAYIMVDSFDFEENLRKERKRMACVIKFFSELEDAGSAPETPADAGENKRLESPDPSSPRGRQITPSPDTRTSHDFEAAPHQYGNIWHELSPAPARPPPPAARGGGRNANNTGGIAPPRGASGPDYRRGADPYRGCWIRRSFARNRRGASLAILATLTTGLPSVAGLNTQHAQTALNIAGRTIAGSSAVGVVVLQTNKEDIGPEWRILSYSLWSVAFLGSAVLTLLRRQVRHRRAFLGATILLAAHLYGYLGGKDKSIGEGLATSGPLALTVSLYLMDVLFEARPDLVEAALGN